MTDLKFEKIESDNYTIVKFENNEPIEPEILKDLKSPNVNATKGIILSGRGPIWLYCYLTHYYHPTKFIATFDPRLGGAVIVETHSKEYNIGELIKLRI